MVVARDPQLTTLKEDPGIVALLKLAKAGITRVGVVVDCSGLPVMSSAGLAQLVKLKRDLGCASGRIRVAGANDDIGRMLHVCHLDEFFGIDTDVVHATSELEGLLRQV